MTMNAITSWLAPSASSVDPYAANPLADEFETADPSAFARSTAYAGPAPKLFENGTRDLPTQTRSGIDPYWLSWLPYGARHHAADLPTEAAVHALAERLAGQPGVRMTHSGLTAAEARMRAWFTAEHTDTAAAKAATAKAQAKRQPVAPPPPSSNSTRDTAHSLGHDVAELLAMSRRGEFLPPKSTLRRQSPVILRRRTRTGRTV